MERFLSVLVEALEKKTVSNIILVHSHNKSTFKSTISLITKQFFGQLEDIVVRVSAGALLIRAQTALTLAFSPVSLSFPSLLKKIYKGMKPDLVHIHMPNTSAFWLLMLPCYRKIRWIIHWHSDVVASKYSWKLRLLYPIYRVFEKKILARANIIIVTSPAYLDTSTTLESWRYKCRVIPLGIKLKDLRHNYRHHSTEVNDVWSRNNLRILAIGRLTYYKGLKYLIGAIKTFPNAHLVVVGDGEQRMELDNLVVENALSKRVIFVGEISELQKHEFLSSCDCLCLSSIERTEAFGLVLLESMLHGKPTIVWVKMPEGKWCRTLISVVLRNRL